MWNILIDPFHDSDGGLIEPPFMFWEWMSCYIARFYMVVLTYCRSRDADLAKLLSYRGPWIEIGEIELKQT